MKLELSSPGIQTIKDDSKKVIDQIFTARKDSPEADTSNLEAEIDRWCMNCMV